MADLDKLTIEDKVRIISGLDTWHTVGVPAADVKSVLMSDGPHGLRLQVNEDGQTGDNLGFNGSAPATALPTGSALASTWNRELLAQTGNVIGREAAAHHVNVVLGPAVNIKRSPLGGRNFEYYSEDPYLVGELATAYINGLQAHQVGASIKHFALNNQETRRMNVNVHVDERTMHEIYLAGFKKAITTAKPWTVMTAYNRVNGEYASNSHLLLDILHKDWQYQGAVISDWTAVDDIIASLKAGLNIEMPGNQAVTPAIVKQALTDGSLTEAQLDAAIRPILRLAEQAATQAPTTAFDLAQQAQAAEAIASETTVLLKNDHQTLPLAADEKVLFIGEMLTKPRFQGGGSSHINAKYLTLIKPTLTATFSEANCQFLPGYQLDDTPDEQLIAEAVAAAKEVTKVVVFAGLPDKYESEGFDRKDIDLPSQQNRLISALAGVNNNVVVVLNNGAPVAMPWVDEVAAIIEAYLPGQAIGQVIPAILTGAINPSGKLAETFPRKLSDTPSYLNFPGTINDVYYGEGIYVGYRYYDAKAIAPLFAFGHGLSYTTFSYQDLVVTPNDSSLHVTATVKNTGQVAGKESIQFYVSDDSGQVTCPPKELKQFTKVSLEPGEAKQVTVEIPLADLAHYDVDAHAWQYTGGTHTIIMAASATDLRLRTTVTLPKIAKPALPVTIHTTIGQLLANEATKPTGMQIITGLAKAFGMDPNSDDSSSAGFDQATVLAMLNDLPIRALASFSAGAIGDTTVQTWIDQANDQIKSK